MWSSQIYSRLLGTLAGSYNLRQNNLRQNNLRQNNLQNNFCPSVCIYIPFTQ